MSDLPKKKCAYNEVSILPYDLIFKILLLLPAKDLIKLSIVCKTWHKLIHSPNFVQLHLNRCETILTFLKHFPESRPDTFSIDTNNNNNNNRFTLFKPTSSKTRNRHMYLLDFNDKNNEVVDPNICGFGEILATCDGLVLATNKTGTLLVFNPTTRKLLPVKPGTMVSHHHDESYGFVFSRDTREYKTVHVFRDKSGHVDSEILSLKTMVWRGCDVPAFGLFRDFDHKPVAASGVLYWLPGNHNVNYIVSMNITDEKFVRKLLPVNGSGLNDRLVENGGLLTFVGQMTVYRIQLWTLKRDESEEKWVKTCTINMDYDLTGLTPVMMTRNGKCLIFKMFKEGIYEYDMEEEEMEEVLLVDGHVNFNYRSSFTHMNTLVSWADSGPLW